MIKFPNQYIALHKQKYSYKEYAIIPIRYKDRLKIMKWRNEQIYHLRQEKPLTKDIQDKYFEDILSSLFTEPKPSQILFSFLHQQVCIGYGGLVHINWTDKNAEVSFLIDTKLEQENFHFMWVTFLKIIEEVAFEELELHKIYVYAFDVRPKLYKALTDAGFYKDATLKEHCFVENCFKDVIIYGKLN